MVDVLLHIGLGKCGSSALQYSLSRNPVQNTKGKKYKNIKYVSIDKHGNLYKGRVLLDRSLHSISGYSSSCSADIKNFSDETFSSLKHQFESISDNGETLIVMSCEVWSRQADIFVENSILEKLGIRARAICYVRNPVEWINSAWWQWGAWEAKHNLDEYIEKAIEKRTARWFYMLQKWQEVLGTDNIAIRVLPKDIVSDFYDFVGVDKTLNQENRNNSSLPAEILRFYQQHRELRSAPHDFIMDFILQNSLEFNDTYSKTPWVLNEDKIQEIIERTKISNQKLMDILDSNSREICEKDQRWWDITAFKSKIISPEVCDEECLSYDDLDNLLLQSFMSIKKLNLKNAALKKRVHKLRKRNKSLQRKPGRKG